MINKNSILIILMVTFFATCFAEEPTFKYPQTPIKKEEKATLIKNDLPITSIRIYTPQNADAVELKDYLLDHFPNIKIHANAKTQKITLQGSEKATKSALEFLKELDNPPAQLVFEIEIIEVSHADLKQYTNALSNLSSGFSINWDFEKKALVLPATLEATLAGLIQNGEAKIIAKPILKTTAYNKAYVRVGDQLPFITSISEGQIKISNFQQINTGIFVEIHPKTVSSSNVLTNLLVEISNVKLWKEINNIQYPILATRKTETTVTLSEDNPLLIAGLFQEDQSKNINKIPLFSKIPLVGHLFKGEKQEKSQTDILIKIKLKFETLRADKK